MKERKPQIPKWNKAKEHWLRTFFRGRCLLPLCLAAILGMAFFGGCGDARTDSLSDARKIYFLTADKSLLSEQDYVPSEDQDLADMSTEQQILDVLLQLSSPTGNVSYVQPVQDFSVEKTTLMGNALTVELSSDYAKLDTTREILTRAAIVNSLCAIDGVDSVSFLCGGEDLKDSEGNLIGAMTSDMFIINSGNEIATYEKVQLHLYFANESGDRLIDTYRTVVYNSNISMERLVVEQVLRGTDSDEVYPTLNPETQILSVTTRDNVCYVNLDQTFLTQPYSVTAQVAIYSLVNSLTELTNVRRVQILIDGDTTRSFMDTSLSAAFERNLAIVGSKE